MPVRLYIPWLLVTVAVAVWSAPGPLPGQYGQPPGGFRGEFSFDRVLQRHDKNEDGKITREEWQGPEEFFQRADSDKNDSLSKEELAKVLATPKRGGPHQIEGPSVVEGRKAGIEVGQYAPDFELQPIELYAKLGEWLGDLPATDGAPKSIEDKVKLSQLVGKQPILLLYGSYT